MKRIRKHATSTQAGRHILFHFVSRAGEKASKQAAQTGPIFLFSCGWSVWLGIYFCSSLEGGHCFAEFETFEVSEAPHPCSTLEKWPIHLDLSECIMVLKSLSAYCLSKWVTQTLWPLISLCNLPLSLFHSLAIKVTSSLSEGKWFNKTDWTNEIRQMSSHEMLFIFSVEKEKDEPLSLKYRPINSKRIFRLGWAVWYSPSYR